MNCRHPEGDDVARAELGGKPPATKFSLQANRVFGQCSVPQKVVGFLCRIRARPITAIGVYVAAEIVPECLALLMRFF